MGEEHSWDDNTFKKISSNEIENAIAKAIGDIAEKECICKIEKITYSNNIIGEMKITLDIEEKRKVTDWMK
ncbi:MAG: hypothetical protein ABFD50_23395 [Smithella sp.]